MSNKIIFDDELHMDPDRMIIGSADNNESEQTYNLEKLTLQVDNLEAAVNNLEASPGPDTVSFLSGKVYHKAGLLANMVTGIIIAAVLILLLI